jgi:nitronate monooxygenase
LDEAKIVDFERYRPHVNGALATQAYASGDSSTGMLDYGPAVVFADAIKPVELIFDELLDDAARALHRLNSLALEGRNQE